MEFCLILPDSAFYTCPKKFAGLNLSRLIFNERKIKMPTIILLDVSLSMTRTIDMGEIGEKRPRRQLAIHGTNTLLDRIASGNKMEFVSLVVFSSLYEQVVPFTRDLDSVKSALIQLGEYDKTNVLSALSGVNSLVLEEWGAVTPCQVILITDGSTGIGPGSLANGIQEFSKTEQNIPDNQPYSLLKSSDFPLPFRFNGKLHILCIASPQDPCLQTCLPLYRRLIEINGNEGELLVPEGALTIKSVEAMFHKLSQTYYRQCVTTLKCGHLQSNVLLFPPPEPYKTCSDSGLVENTMYQTLDIMGFLSIGDVSSPPVVSKHLVLPVTASGALKSDADHDNSDVKEEEEKQDDGKSPSFTVLLHGSLKVEGMVAIAHIGDDWYGMLYSWADSKKKSNLMLSPFEPGSDHIPWLGSFSSLSPISDFAEPPYGYDDGRSPFPIRQDRRSYAQNSTVWIKAPGLQADVQKILRHGRKLPEKQQHFYKELNRLRRMALSLGFVELLSAMAVMLERECQLLPGNSHPDAALQLSHASSVLKSDSGRDYASNILPLRTNFSTDD